MKSICHYPKEFAVYVVGHWDPSEVLEQGFTQWGLHFIKINCSTATGEHRCCLKTHVYTITSESTHSLTLHHSNSSTSKCAFT